MQDVIKLLPDSVANQIAAGEVIQQPSSVVKELVENSVDAGAMKIDVYIRDAGRTLIQVIDNGSGMTATDARLAFERHSTSKIREAGDLFALTTMGFRGEALASIAAVSQLDVRTMPHDATIGTRLLISGSKVESQEPEVTSCGTNFMVKNLFFNVPARRKFLKKDSVEFANILHEFERLALVNPGIELSLYHNDELIHSLSRSNLKTRIGELFGRSMEDSLVPIESNTELVKIGGFVGTPQSARKRGALQYFFVNGRNMRHPYFRKAVLACYEKLIAPDMQPNFFIDFEIDPSSIDINIHPTKNEIKFDNEQSIWQLLIAAIRESLGRFNLGPSLDFDTPPFIEMPSLGSSNFSKPVSMPGVGSTVGYNPFKESGGSKKSDSHFLNEKRKALGWEQVYQPQPSEELAPQSLLPVEDTAFPSATRYLQLGGKYILTPSSNGVYVINQREAHVRVLYDSIVKDISQHKIGSQNLLFTSIVNLADAQIVIVDSIYDSLLEAGFVLESVDRGQWELKALPSVLKGTDGTEILYDIIDNVSQLLTEGKDIPDALTHIISLSLAHSSAIRYGQSLSNDEIEHLVGSLFASESPAIGPDGKTIIAELALKNIETLF